MYFLLTAVKMIDWLKITLQKWYKKKYGGNLIPANHGLHDFYWACPYMALATALISYWSHVFDLLILHRRGI